MGIARRHAGLRAVCSKKLAGYVFPDPYLRIGGDRAAHRANRIGPQRAKARQIPSSNQPLDIAL